MNASDYADVIYVDFQLKKTEVLDDEINDRLLRIRKSIVKCNALLSEIKRGSCGGLHLGV